MPPFPIWHENVSLAPHQDVVAALIFSSVATHRPCSAWKCSCALTAEGRKNAKQKETGGAEEDT